MRLDIRKAVEQHRDEIIFLAQDLVCIPSENHPPGGCEREVQEYIANFWRNIGIECDIFLPTEVPGFESHPGYCELGRNYEGRPVVVAKFPGSGGGRSLIFSGHADTVAIGPGEWQDDPYSAAIKDGRLYGRGSFDMKGGIAAMMMAARILREMDIKLNGDLLVETVPDEEFASGNGTVASRAKGYSADAAVITEPTGLNVVTGHRGFRLVQVAIAGKTGIPVYGGEMVNPVQHLPAILQGIENFRALRLPVTTEDTLMITKLGANEFRSDELLTVPPECRIEVYWQLMPEDEITDVDAVFEAAVREACVSDPYFEANPPQITYHLRGMPGSRVPVDAPIVKAACASVESVTEKQAGILTAFPPCDSFVFNRYSNIPAIVLGPGGDNAHAPDEYVLVDDLVLCTEIYANLAASWCGI